MVKEKLMERYDWQQRTELLLGEEKMERIRNAHVLVVGLGGVGAYAERNLRTRIHITITICSHDCRCRYSAAY